MKRLFRAVLTAMVLVSLLVAPVSAKTHVTKSPMETFQPAGPKGEDGLLEEGAEFPPAPNDHATLKRGNDWIQVNIHTSGLPPGAYTVWWIVFGKPELCSDNICDGNDLGVTDGISVFWATGGVVQKNGIGNFVARYTMGDDRAPDYPDQNPIDAGDFDTKKAEIHNVVKYHGAASSDPAELHLQTHSLLGLCNEAANHYPDPPGHCFDPQAVGFAPVQ